MGGGSVRVRKIKEDGKGEEKNRPWRKEISKTMKLEERWEVEVLE